MSRRVIAAVFVAIAAALVFPLSSFASPNLLVTDQASVVWGQYGSFTSSTANNSSVPSGSSCTNPPAPASECTLNFPESVALDAAGNVWVADASNNRVLMYPKGSTAATQVLGQANLTADGLAATRTTMHDPEGVAVDDTGGPLNGTLYVSELLNNRVLVYLNAAGKANGGVADLVLGQPNFTSHGANNTPAGGTAPYTCSAPTSSGKPNECDLTAPIGLFVDAWGDLLVADEGNSRVLMWSASTLQHFAGLVGSSDPCATTCDIPASQVWGQYGSFTTNGANQPLGSATSACAATSGGTPTSCTLSSPEGVTADALGDLFIADSFNNRVLEYDGALYRDLGRQNATMVYGQAGNFGGQAVGCGPSSLNEPFDVALDPFGNLWVADSFNRRVVEFPQPVTTNRTNATTAIGVLGQRGNLDTCFANDLGLDQGSLSLPASVAFDANGNAYVVDPQNDRVLEYLATGTPSGPTAGAAAFNITHKGAKLTFHWKVTYRSNIVGFNLYQGGYRVNGRLIVAHAGPSYSYSTRWPHYKGSYSLKAVLVNGSQENLGSRTVR